MQVVKLNDLINKLNMLGEFIDNTAEVDFNNCKCIILREKKDRYTIYLINKASNMFYSSILMNVYDMLDGSIDTREEYY